MKGVGWTWRKRFVPQRSHFGIMVHWSTTFVQDTHDIKNIGSILFLLKHEALFGHRVT